MALGSRAFLKFSLAIEQASVLNPFVPVKGILMEVDLLILIG